MAAGREAPELLKSSAKKRRLEVSIEHLPIIDGASAPYAAYFPAGIPNGLHECAQRGRPNELDDGLTFQAYRNAAPFRGKHHLLVGRGEGVDYVGSNLPITKGSRYAVGLFNKADGTLKLAALAGDKVFRMEPRVPGLEYENDGTAGTSPEEEPERDQAAIAADRRMKKELLVETFGSKKARVQQNARLREKVEEDAIADPSALASLLATAVKAVPSREEATRSLTSIELRLIPPCNPEATTPTGVYAVDRLIPPQAQAALNLDPYQRASNHPDRPLKMYFRGEVPGLVSGRVHKLVVEGDPRGSADRLKCLAYLTHVVDFYRLSIQMIQRFFSSRRVGEGAATVPGRGVEALARDMGMPVLVLETLMDLFLTKVEGEGGGTEYTRPQRSAELHIAYILVLALHVDQFCSDPADIAAALQLTVAQLLPRYKELGCKVRKLTKPQKEATGSVSGYEVTLPVPVVFPAIKRGR